MVLNGRPGALGSGAGWTQGARQVEAAGADRDKQAPQVDEEYARPRLRLRRYEESAEAGSPGGAAAATRVSSPMRTANGFPSDVPLRSASGQQHTTPGMGDRRVNGTPDRLRSGHRSERRRPPVGRREAAMLLRAQVGAAHGTAASSTGPPARQYAENDRRGRYSLRQAKRHARYVDDDDSDESFTRTGGAENGGIGQPRYALRNHTSHGAEKRVCRFSVSSSASSGRSRHRSRSRPTRSRRYEEPSFNDDEEACSSEEVDALFAAEEARELQEAEELERTVKLDDDASGSVSEKADDSESDDREDDDFRYLEPRRSKRYRQSVKRWTPLAANGREPAVGQRDAQRNRRADRWEARDVLTRSLRPFSARGVRYDADSDSMSEASDEVAWNRREKRRLAALYEGIAPINMDMGGTASGGLASRSPQGHMQPDRLRANALEPLRVDPHLTWDRVGGLEHHVRALKEMVFLPLVYPEFFQRFQSEPPRGVLFYGPPGTGKTLVARTLAATCAAASGARVAFFMRNGADCLSKWVGEAERQLRLTFEAARAHQPSIIFFDEIDGLAPVRSSKQDQIHSSIVSTLLGLMDGLETRGQIVVIGATNRIDAIDPALRRPGRFDRELVFGLPNREARRAILQIHTRNWQPPLSVDLLDRLAAGTVGFGGADLRSLCSEAALQALRRRYPQIYDSTDKLLIDPEQVQVTEPDFEAATRDLVPSAHRSAMVQARPLDAAHERLLRDTLHAALQLLGAERVAHSLRSGRRFLLHGPPGNGQMALARAIAHHVETLRLHAIDLLSLQADPVARSPQEALQVIVREALRSAPSILLVPHLELYLDGANEALRMSLEVALKDLPADVPVLVLAAADQDLSGYVERDTALPTAADEADVVESWIRLFYDGPHAVMRIAPPSAAARERLLAPLVREAASSPSTTAAPGAAPPKAGAPAEVLAKVPPPAPPPPSAAEVERRRRLEERALREFRLTMRDFVESLLSDKKYRPFWQPVQERDAPDYHEIVQQPMDLSRLLQHIDDRRIQTLSELVAAFELIAQNALAYNSQREERGLRIRSKATALVDLVHRWADLVTDPEENEHESEVIRQCEAIVQRRRAETIQQAEQRRRTRSSGDAGVLSFEEAAALERAARCVYRNRERVVAEERQDEGEDAVSSDVDRQRAEAEAARRRRRGEDTAAMTTVVSDAPTEGDYIGGADEEGATRTMEAAAAPPPDAELSAMLPLTEAVRLPSEEHIVAVVDAAVHVSEGSSAEALLRWRAELSHWLHQGHAESADRVAVLESLQRRIELGNADAMERRA
ncbi:hypothetical protein CDCA_CDCA11G3254 [Cyanidium caldarium]|uniref:Bromo domain-containing protein n=1 Tax=Cyanidium caldarium TaxID=2771 RepID=A0AAV9IYR0_CYACA|nr:hypothetical protein CDCA_CDCA11G3254 [Cyanidium caldarium]